jgi:GxxExxY protein
MLLFKETADIIIRCFYNVYNVPGFCFLEKVYKNALVIELKANRVNAYRQTPIDVFYKGDLVGNYFADIIVKNKIIVELKAGEKGLVEEHELQLINYLKATQMEVGLLLSLGKKPEFKRKIFTNNNNNK